MICVWCLRACFSFWGLLVLVLRVVQDAADRRLGLRRDFDQVEVAILRHLQRLVDREDPDLRAIVTDDPHFGYTNPLVDPSGVPLRHPPVKASGDRH